MQKEAKGLKTVKKVDYNLGVEVATFSRVIIISGTIELRSNFMTHSKNWCCRYLMNTRVKLLLLGQLKLCGKTV